MPFETPACKNPLRGLPLRVRAPRQRHARSASVQLVGDSPSCTTRAWLTQTIQAPTSLLMPPLCGSLQEKCRCLLCSSLQVSSFLQTLLSFFFLQVSA
jgi:hypothetical protein